MVGEVISYQIAFHYKNIESFIKNKMTHLFLKFTWQTTELSGTVNKQNFRYWPSENPCKLHERSLHSPKVAIEGVIAGISQDILGRVAEKTYLKGSICALLDKTATWTILLSKHCEKKNRYYMYFWAIKTFSMYLEPFSYN